VIAGVTRACQGRPVDPDAVAQLAQAVEETVRGSGQAEVQSQDVGLAILGPLRDLDEVAYLRFASVYRSFEDVADFRDELDRLERELPDEGQLPLLEEKRLPEATRATQRSSSGKDK
jgi:transcriptional repressor NrdR